ncbi:MAG: ABC transporter permease, partial [Rhodospirillaceae bacterium]|nr:ABC transporter permease [Rhodospirillaceae bacterium]
MSAPAAAPALRLLTHRVTLTYLLVAGIWVVAGFVLRGFASFGHLRYMVELAAIMGIAAAGQTLVVIGAGIDLSVAGVITFTTMMVPLVSPAWDATGLVGVALTLAMALGVGVLNGLGTVFLRVHPLVLTLATATILRGVMFLIAGGSAVSTTNPAVIWLGNAHVLGAPVTILTWIVVAAVILALLHRTVFGAWVYAVGTNERAARLSGAGVR